VAQVKEPEGTRLSAARPNLSAGALTVRPHAHDARYGVAFRHVDGRPVLQSGAQNLGGGGTRAGHARGLDCGGPLPRRQRGKLGAVVRQG